MSGLRLTPEEQRAVCEDLLAIEQADRLDELADLRRRMLFDLRTPHVWQQIATDRLARQASNFIGGSPGYWREAAAAALGSPSRVGVCIEAVCRVADDVRWQEPKPAPEQPRHRATLGSRKRGGR
jgi:hypothetical protein